MRSEFEKWFKTTKIYKDTLNLELLLTYQSEVASDPLEKGTSVGINGNVEFYLWSEAESAWETWQHRQTEVDELKASHHGEMIGHEHHISKIKEQNAWLSDVAERENKRANNLQQDKTSTTILLGKTIQEKNDLQKRLDAALKRSKHALQYVEEDRRGDFEFLQMAMIRVFKDLEQALKGEHDA